MPPTARFLLFDSRRNCIKLQLTGYHPVEVGYEQILFPSDFALLLVEFAHSEETSLLEIVTL